MGEKVHLMLGASDERARSLKLINRSTTTNAARSTVAAICCLRRAGSSTGSSKWGREADISEEAGVAIEMVCFEATWTAALNLNLLSCAAMINVHTVYAYTCS
jgi:hypothetical protein